MNAFTIAGIVGILVIILGIIAASLFVRLSQMVTENRLVLEEAKSTTNPNVTLGFEIPVDADISEQLAVARKLAAQKAAMLPRGANMRIGRLGQTNLNTAGKAIDQDPFTAVKIAAFHTWAGAKAGPPVGGAAPAATAAQQVVQAAPTKRPEDLVPGKDYPFIEITDDMSPDDVRRARITNARARSSAVKALKEQATAAPAATVAPAPATAAATAETAATPAVDAAAAGIQEPEYIEITEDMPADEVRKARVQNARERSRFYKALKDRGIDPQEWEARQQAADGAAAQPAAASAPAAEEVAEPVAAAAEEATATQDATAVAIPDHIMQPDYIEITEGMSPDEVRRARVHNSRERSRYFKALKDAGIDPKTVAEQS